jgi:peptide/nickel transport system substrate-binding protein
LLADFTGGVFFGNLAPVPDPALVPLSIAQTLGVGVLGAQLPLERLQDHLRDKQLLLVLDNFEHLLDAAPQLAALLAVAPGLTVLVTSRVVLRLSGEQEFPVPPLPVPDLQCLTGLEALSQVAAVALFIQRAQAAQPDFALTELTAPAVAEICVRLDGLPLAIELAAARSKVLQPGARLARLSSRLGLLTGGARDLPARQQTLRSTIDWSYRLLAAEEQVLFARLGVFVGGWTVEAAEEVCNAAGDLRFDLLDGLQALLDQSLIRQEIWGDSTPRFGMLETIGEYAQERLDVSAEAQPIRRQHAAYFLALAEAGVPTIWQRPLAARLDQIATEHDNLRAATTWAQSSLGDADLGLRLAVATVFSGGYTGRHEARRPLPLSPRRPTRLSAGPLSDVPRNRTVVVALPLWEPYNVTNPWNRDYSHHNGNNLLWEGLAYYGIFASQEIPWLAQSLAYTRPDFTELTIKLNPLAKWSDGRPVTGQDVIFTFQGQLDNDNLKYHSEFQKSVQAFEALDDRTVVLTFKTPAPRFKFEVLTLKFDHGIPIVPAHALSQQADPKAFAGGLDMPHSGPYNLVEWDVDRKVFDLRPDWWAVEAGLISQPAVKRVTYLDFTDASRDTLAQRLVNNDFDTSFDVSGSLIAAMLEQNPKITTYTGSAPPYGYLDWWPLSLWVNTQLAPYDDARVRRAFSLAIDRHKIDQVLFAGAAFATVYPFPLYPALQKFVDSPDVKALEAKYQPGKFDPAECARLMIAAGFAKNSDGFWARDGQALNATVHGLGSNQSPFAQIVVEMFRQAGFNSFAYFGQDSYDKGIDGSPGLYLFGHGASVTDPYAAFEIYHSRHSQRVSTPDDIHFSRYQNPAYDQIVDAMAVLSPDDPQFHRLAVQAMEIYWRDVIDIPVVQALHRLPYNQTYWTNWPTQDNPALGTNGAFWAQTGMLVITGLRPAQ